MRKLGEELQEVKDLYEAEQHKTLSSKEELRKLHNQVSPDGQVHTRFKTSESRGGLK